MNSLFALISNMPNSIPLPPCGEGAGGGVSVVSAPYSCQHPLLLLPNAAQST